MTAPERVLRILVVEDHPATARALAKTLLRFGFAVATSATARAAVHVARQQPFDLLITDIGLPEKNGWELFQELRAVQPNLRAIALTGYAFPQDRQRSADAGIQLHLVKPATTEQLQAAIMQLFPEQAAAFAGRSNNPIPPTPGISPIGQGRKRWYGGGMRLLYLEDDRHDVELLEMQLGHDAPDCEITPVEDRATFVAALQSGGYAGILSDSGVHDLFGSDAVKLARSLAPGLPYVFLCGMMSDAKRADLLAANPDGIFSKDRPGDVALAVGLLRKLGGERASDVNGPNP